MLYPIEHIPHVFVPLSMQLEGREKICDVVDIFDYYEEELENIYTTASVIEKPANVPTVQQVQSTERQSSLPDQPGAHFNKLDENDHMKKITVPFGGDQLTLVRFAGAKDLRSGSRVQQKIG